MSPIKELKAFKSYNYKNRQRIQKAQCSPRGPKTDATVNVTDKEWCS